MCGTQNQPKIEVVGRIATNKDKKRRISTKFVFFRSWFNVAPSAIMRKRKRLSVEEVVAGNVKILRDFAHHIEVGFSAARLPKTDGLVAHTQSVAELPLREVILEAQPF